VTKRSQAEHRRPTGRRAQTSRLLRGRRSPTGCPYGHTAHRICERTSCRGIRRCASPFGAPIGWDCHGRRPRSSGEQLGITTKAEPRARMQKSTTLRARCSSTPRTGSGYVTEARWVDLPTTTRRSTRIHGNVMWASSSRSTTRARVRGLQRARLICWRCETRCPHRARMDDVYQTGRIRH